MAEAGVFFKPGGGVDSGPGFVGLEGVITAEKDPGELPIRSATMPVKRAW